MRGATLVLISGTESHDAGQLSLFYNMRDLFSNLDIRIIEKTQFIETHGLKILCIPEEYGKGTAYYEMFLKQTYDAVFMHGTLVGGIPGATKEDLNAKREPVFSIDSFSGCKGPIISGHVHTAMCLQQHMYYLSSPIRYRFGEEAEKGYDSKMRYRPQLNVVYAFSLSDEEARPAYYSKYAGSITDTACLRDFLSESGITGDVTIVADKGFMSGANAEEITDSGLDYIIPLKRGNAAARDRTPSSPEGYDETFVYNGRPIFCSSFTSEGKAVHLFLDTDLYADEMKDLMARMERGNNRTEERKEKERKRREKGKGRLSDEELARLVPKDMHDVLRDHPGMGTITIETTRTELNARQVFAMYKQRQQIEQCFKAYDDSLGFDSSYMHNDTSMEAWLFLNHLSLMMEYDALSEIYLNAEDRNVSFEDLREALQKVKAVKISGKWVAAVRRKKIDEIASAVSFNPWTISLPIQQPKN